MAFSIPSPSWLLHWSAAWRYILMGWKTLFYLVFKCPGDQSQQFNHTDFKTSTSFCELPWFPATHWSRKLPWMLYSLSELYNDESHRGCIDFAKVFHIFSSACFVKHNMRGWLSEKKQIEIFLSLPDCSYILQILRSTLEEVQDIWSQVTDT